jgi:hypothetical protein
MAPRRAWLLAAAFSWALTLVLAQLAAGSAAAGRELLAGTDAATTAWSAGEFHVYAPGVVNRSDIIRNSWPGQSTEGVDFTIPATANESYLVQRTAAAARGLRLSASYLSDSASWPDCMSGLLPSPDGTVSLQPISVTFREEHQ